MERKITDAEEAALRAVAGGRVPCDDLPAGQSTDVFGNPIPGQRTFRALERMGLLIFTEEEPVFLDGWDEPFTFTAFIELTEEGRKVMKSGVISLPDTGARKTG